MTSSDAVSVRLLQMCHNRHMFGAYTSPNEHLVSTGSSLYKMCMSLNAGQTQATTGEKESILTSFAAMAWESSGDLGNPWLDRLPGVLAGVILRLPVYSHLSMINVGPSTFTILFQAPRPFSDLRVPFHWAILLQKMYMCIYK